MFTIRLMSTGRESEDKMSKEESKLLGALLGIIRRKDPSLAEWVKEFCKITNMKIHELIITALRSFRISIEAGDILKNLNAEEWNKLKMAILYDLDVTLKIAMNYQVLYQSYMADTLRTVEGDLMKKIGLKRAYRERAKAFDTFMEMVNHVLEMNKMLISKIEEVSNEMKKLLSMQATDKVDGKEKT